MLLHSSFLASLFNVLFCCSQHTQEKCEGKKVTYSTTWRGQPWDVILLCCCSSELRVVRTEPSACKLVGWELIFVRLPAKSRFGDFFHMEVYVLHEAIGKGKPCIHPWFHRELYPCKMIESFVVLVLDTQSVVSSELPSEDPGFCTCVLSHNRSSWCPLGGSTGQWTGCSCQPAPLSARTAKDSTWKKASGLCLTIIPVCPDSSTASIIYLFSSHTQSHSRSIRLILTLEVVLFQLYPH